MQGDRVELCSDPAAMAFQPAAALYDLLAGAAAGRFILNHTYRDQPVAAPVDVVDIEPDRTC